MRLIAVLLLLAPIWVSAQTHYYNQLEVHVAGVLPEKYPVGKAQTVTRRCWEKFGMKSMQGVDVEAHWMTTEEADYLLRNGVSIDEFDDVRALRAVDVRFQPSGNPYDPYLGAVGSSASAFPGAVLWKGNRKWFPSSHGTTQKAVCAFSVVDR